MGTRDLHGFRAGANGQTLAHAHRPRSNLSCSIASFSLCFQALSLCATVYPVSVLSSLCAMPSLCGLSSPIAACFQALSLCYTLSLCYNLSLCFHALSLCALPSVLSKL